MLVKDRSLPLFRGAEWSKNNPLSAARLRGGTVPFGCGQNGRRYCKEFDLLEHSRQFAELKGLVLREQLLDKQRYNYAIRILLNFCLFGLVLGILFYVKGFGWQLLNAAFFAFVSTQMGFIVHDSGHHQILRGDWQNDLLGIFHADLVLGFSYMRWVTVHNMHHSHPNKIGADPDTDFPLLALTEEQAIQKRGIGRYVARYQSQLFFPMLFLEAVNLKADCVRFLYKNNARYRWTEVGCLVLYFFWYCGLIFHCLGFGRAILFIVVHQALFGLYLSMVIAPNHIGMPVLEENSELDFLSRQVLTTRNLRRHVLTDYLFGPLCCQIEHHLFPTIPVNKLRQAQDIVRPYCEGHQLAYYETSPLQSYREILSFLHKVSSPLRATSKRGTIDGYPKTN
jgi:fatty acid desaturase